MVRCAYNTAAFSLTEPTSSDGLNPQETVGIIVGIASVATILIILVLIGLMICQYCFHKRNRRQLRTATYYDNSLGRSGTFTRDRSREQFSMGFTGGYGASNDSGVS